MGKILFHHLAKTAGTTLIESLEKIFKGRMCDARYDHELSDEMMIDSDFVFYHGHYSFNQVKKFKDINPDSFIFTFVRHPFNRVLSQYYNWIDRERVEWELSAVQARSGENKTFSERRTKFENMLFNMSLDEFLASDDPDVLEVTFNHQAGYVSDETERNKIARLSMAVDNILSFYNYVGLMEFYSPCLHILESKLGLVRGTVGQMPRKNTNDDRKAGGRYCITQEQLNLLVAKNGFDMAMHAAAYGRLVKDYAEYLPTPAAEFHDLIGLPTIKAE